MTRHRMTAIMSGGQTGADRGGMDAAIELGIGWGGWAPAGWRAEDGEIPPIYRARMRCTTSPEYGMRTRLNVQDSDGTLLLSFGQELSGGSAFTEKTAERMRKPYLHLVLPDRGRTRIPDEVRTELLGWIAACRISVLNVAGPRESKETGLQQAVRDALVWIFEDEGDVVPPYSDEASAISADLVRRVLGEVTPAVEHDAGCGSIGAPGFCCAACGRDLCWGCERPLPAGHEIKTAVRWCKADACQLAEVRENFGIEPSDRDGMPGPAEILAAIKLHGLSGAGEALMQAFPEARRRFESKQGADDGIDIKVRSYANEIAGPVAYINMSDWTDEQIAAFAASMLENQTSEET